MALSVDPKTFIIHVPKSDLTLVQSTPTEIYDLNLNTFRLNLKAWEESVEGIVFQKTHNHNTEVSLGGLTFARVIEIIEPYTITFEDGQYAVNLVGANSNIGDKVNVNQVSVRSQNSAGLISSPEIEYASFNGGVIIDATSPYSGTLFPIGTEQKPVNNIADAILIAEYRGFNKLYIRSDLSFDQVYTLDGYHLIGQSHVNIDVNIQPAALVEKITIDNCRISGVLDGESHINFSVLGDVENFNGHVHSSSLNGTVVLGGGANSFFHEISQLDVHVTPTFDMGGAGQSLVMTNYTGYVNIINMNDINAAVGIGLDAGAVYLDANTVTSGTISVSGTGSLFDLDGNRILTGVWNGGVNIVNTLINKDTISEATQLGGYVYIDVLNGVSGTDFPTGTKRVPSNNLDDAILIAESLNVRDLYFLGNYTFDADVWIDEYKLYGDGIVNTTFTFVAGCIVNHCEAYDATLTGNLSGITGIHRSKVLDLGSIGLIPSSQEIFVTDTLIDGTISLPSNYSGKLTVINCQSNVVGQATPTLNFGDSTALLQMRNYTGGIKLDNMTQGNNMSIDLISGQIRLTTNCTNARITGRGVGKLVEDATGEYIPEGVWNGGVTVYNDIISKGTIATAVWDESIASHLIDGSTGKSIGIQQFNGSVRINTTTGVSGVDFPIGTERVPVDNLADALTIASNNGLETLSFTSNYTINAGESVSGYVLTSSNHSTITLTPGCFTMYSSFTDANIAGQFFGYVIIDNCSIDSSGVSDYYGIMDRVTFNGGVGVISDNTKNAIFIDCYTGDVSGPPTIDAGGDGAKISIRGLTGAFLFSNKTGATQKMFIDLYSARVGFDSTVTAGNITVRGVGYIYQDDSTNTTFDLQGLMSQPTMADAVWDEDIASHLTTNTFGHQMYHMAYAEQVVVDEINGQAGTTFPLGTHEYPVSNVTDAVTIANIHGFQNIHINGAVTIGSGVDVSGYTILAERSLGNSVIVENGAITNGTYFTDLTISGVMNGSVRYTTCVLGAIDNFDGGAKNSLLTNTINITGNGANYFTDCDTYITESGESALKEINVGDNLLNIIRCRGTYKITNKTGDSTTAIDLVAGIINVDSTCTVGEIHISGLSRVSDNSSVGCEVHNYAISRDDIDEILEAIRKTQQLIFAN